MSAYIFQSIILSAIAFVVGLLLGRFLKSFFCKDRTYGDRVEKYVTRTESTHTEYGSSGSSNVAKVAAAAVVAGGAAVVATKVMADDSANEVAEKAESHDRKVTMGDEARAVTVDEDAQVDDSSTQYAVDGSDNVEVHRTNLLDDHGHDEIDATIQGEVEIEDVAATVESGVEIGESVSIETPDIDDNSLLDTVKSTVAVAGAGVAAKVGADALSEDDSLESTSTTDEVISEDQDSITSDSENVSTDVTESVDTEEVEVAEIETSLPEGKVEHVAEESPTLDVVDMDTPLTDTISEEVSTSDEDVAELKEEDDSSILDALKTTAALAGAGIAAKVGADALADNDVAEVDNIDAELATTADVEDVIDMEAAGETVEAGLSVDETVDTEVVDSEEGSVAAEQLTDSEAVDVTEVTTGEVTGGVEVGSADTDQLADSEAVDAAEVTTDEVAGDVEVGGADTGQLADSDAVDVAEITTDEVADTGISDSDIEANVSTDDGSLGNVAKGSAALAAAGLAATVVSKADDSDAVEKSTDEADTAATEESAESGKKNALIKEMLEMQSKFIADEQAGNFDAEDYYIGEGKEYRQRYHELAAEVRELASKEANFWK